MWFEQRLVQAKDGTEMIEVSEFVVNPMVLEKPLLWIQTAENKLTAIVQKPLLSYPLEEVTVDPRTAGHKSPKRTVHNFVPI